jgi:hypothetical protein
MSAETPAESLVRRRSGSQQRQRRAVIACRVSPQEKEQIGQLADQRGVSPGALLRDTLLALPLPPARRATDDARGAAGRFLHQLGAIHAELGKSGSNLNQIAHHLNAGRDPDAPYVVSAAAALLENHRQAVVKLDDLWRACMEAMGKRPGE